MKNNLINGLLLGCVILFCIPCGAMEPSKNDLYLVSTPRVVSDSGCQQIVGDIASYCNYDKYEVWNNTRSVLWSTKRKGMAMANCLVAADDAVSVAFAAAYSAKADVDAKCLRDEYKKRVDAIK